MGLFSDVLASLELGPFRKVSDSSIVPIFTTFFITFSPVFLSPCLLVSLSPCFPVSLSVSVFNFFSCYWSDPFLAWSQWDHVLKLLALSALSPLCPLCPLSPLSLLSPLQYLTGTWYLTWYFFAIPNPYPICFPNYQVSGGYFLKVGFW